MSKKTLIITIIVSVIALILLAIYSNYSKSTPEYTNREQALQDLVERPDVTINVKHQYKEDVHTYLGKIETPTPCHSYNAEIINNEGEKIINLTYEESRNKVCSQVVTERDFKVSFQGSESDANSVIARLNGQLINLNIFEVPQSQNIEDFQIFIKG